MRRLTCRTFILAALSATALAAQPARNAAARTPPMQALSLDLGAAMQDRWSLALEPLVFGRLSIGVGASHSIRTSERGAVLPPMVARTAPATLFAPCLPTGCAPIPPAEDRHRASSLGLRLRWYPKALSSGGERRGIAGYLGESLDWQQRTATTYTYYPAPMGADTLLVAGAIDWPYGETFKRRYHGLEPSFEFGTRLMMSRRVLVDVGVSTRLVRLDDPNSRLRPGDTESRLSFSLGFGW